MKRIWGDRNPGRRLLCRRGLAPVTPAIAQSPSPTVQAQAIIGEWQGQWRSPRAASRGGTYFMTGNRVFTRLYIMTDTRFEGDREATLSGNTSRSPLRATRRCSR